MLSGEKFKVDCRCLIGLSRDLQVGVKNNYIFGIHTPNLAIHYDTYGAPMKNKGCLLLRPLTVADPGFDGRGRKRGSGGLAPRYGGMGQRPQQGCRQSPRWVVWGEAPQKPKHKNGLNACRKAFGNVECPVCPSEPTLNLCIILVRYS